MFGFTTFAQSPFASLGGNTYLESLTESLSPADSVTGVTSIPVVVSESVAVTATAYSIQAVAAAIQESVLADSSLATTMLALASLTETTTAGTIVDGLYGKFVYVTEAVAATDVLSAAGSTYNVERSETNLASDEFATGNVIPVYVSESATPSATESALIQFNQSITEAVTAGDVYTVVGNLVAALNESAPAGATQAGGIGSYVNISEAAAASDTVVPGNVVSVLITELASPQDSQTEDMVIPVGLTETVTAADTITYTVDTKGIVTGVLLTITLTTPLVWEPINNDQSPVWVQIKD